MVALAFEAVDKSFGTTRSLVGVSLEIQEGLVTGLLGPNGAGKTTLIRIGMDIIRPDAGRVRLFGSALAREELDRIGYLPEERGLYRKVRVIDLLTYFGELKGLRRADARARGLDWLARVGLPDVAKQRIDALSKGMSQKVQLAVTLMTEPRLAILDEPFSGLDPVNIELVKGLIQDRREAGHTTVLSTHMMDQVEVLCDRVAMVHDGHLVLDGALEEVRQRYSVPELVIVADAALPEIEGARLLSSEGDESTLELLNGLEPADAVARLVEAGVRVRRVEPHRASMEEIFLRVVREAA
ncbi:MAG: ATP-binding cassette domain-containing protein [Deltaproteobacteria bacterium]|nr:ATP-binding cassette domain-containing protein [Deltaproteobacteria bacterium]